MPPESSFSFDRPRAEILPQPIAIRHIGKVTRNSPFACLLLLALSPGALAETGADAWITHPDRPPAPVVLEFRRELTAERVPTHLPVEITADNRFVLRVNGVVAARGPSTGTLQSWRYSTVDLAPLMRPGRNELHAHVWNYGNVAPLAQQSLATGFRLWVEAGLAF